MHWPALGRLVTGAHYAWMLDRLSRHHLVLKSFVLSPYPEDCHSMKWVIPCVQSPYEDNWILMTLAIIWSYFKNCNTQWLHLPLMIINNNGLLHLMQMLMSASCQTTLVMREHYASILLVPISVAVLQGMNFKEIKLPAEVSPSTFPHPLAWYFVWLLSVFWLWIKGSLTKVMGWKLNHNACLGPGPWYSVALKGLLDSHYSMLLWGKSKQLITLHLSRCKWMPVGLCGMWTKLHQCGWVIWMWLQRWLWNQCGWQNMRW